MAKPKILFANEERALRRSMKVNENKNRSGVKSESPRPAQQNPLPCGCGIKGTPYIGAYGSEYELRQEYKNMFIDFCPLHKAADALVEAAQALLDRIDNITTDEFSRGGDRAEREALRDVLIEIAKGK